MFLNEHLWFIGQTWPYFDKSLFIHPASIHIGINITLFRPTTVFCGTDNILWNISHIRPKYEEYFT